MSSPLPVLPSTPAALTLDPRTYDRALSCVHCGLCLPACPTYLVTGHEADSPRGRIQLMRGLADGVIDLSPTVQKHLDLCLDCRGCETACPSGVIYHELIEETRERFHEASPGAATAQGRLMRWLFFNVFVHPRRLKLALLPARLMQRIGLYGLLRRSGLMRLLPTSLAKMEQMLPAAGRIWPKQLPELTPARASGAATVRIGFLSGCVGQVMFDEVNAKAVKLLAAAGAEVLAPAAQECCGAIHHHNGAWEAARAKARRNIDLFLPAGTPGVKYITSTIAGCGAMLHEYDHLLRDDPAYAERAREFARRVRDIAEVLLELGLPPMPHRVERTITYHDACHLLHAQKVATAPRKLLAQVPGLKLVPLPESDICCGAAGTYNLTQPAMATTLAQRKLRNIAATGAPTCATGNVGCAMHIQGQAHAATQPLEVVHPVEILYEAVFGR